MKIQLLNENPSGRIDERFRLIERAIEYDPEIGLLIEEIPDKVLVEIFERDDEGAPPLGAAIDFETSGEGPVINITCEYDPLKTLLYFLFELCNAANADMRELSVSRTEFLRDALDRGMMPSDIAHRFAESCQAAEKESSKRYLRVLKSIVHHIDDLGLDGVLTDRAVKELEEEISRLDIIDPTKKIVKFKKTTKVESHYHYFYQIMLKQAESMQRIIMEEDEIFYSLLVNYQLTLQDAIIKFYDNPEMFLVIIDNYSLANDDVRDIIDERDIDSLEALIESIETLESF